MNRTLRRVELPVAWFAFIAFPAYLVVFSYARVGAHLGPRYLVDVATFCAGFYLLGLLLLSIRNRFGGGALLGLACAIVITFHWANLLFYYFFWDWMPFDAVWLIPDLSDVGSGLPRLYGTDDIVRALVVPIMLALCAIGFRPRRTAVATLGLAALLVPLLVLQRRPEMPQRFNDADPFMAFLRQGIAQLTDGWFGHNDYRTLVTERDRLFTLHDAAYRYAGAGAGLFLRLPPAGQLPASAPPRPNVVLLVLESFRAYESGTYGAAPSFTPFLDELARDALVFDPFYANGVQTVRGEFALLASQYDNLGGGPHYVLHPMVHLTTLPSILKSYGYQTSQIQAYNGDFQNMRLFLTHHGVDRVYDWSDMPPGDTLGWGLNDASMFTRAVEIIGTQQAPFFAEILSLSNHFPFDTYPTDAACPQVDGSTTYRAYTHGIFYTDDALRQFFAAARQQPWFRNTIFLITGDHGLFLFPDAPRLTQAQRQEAAFRLPLLLYAPGLISAGRRNIIGSQVDVAPTLLDILRLRCANTFVGRSLVAERDDLAERFAILVQQSNWFLRMGPRYYYGVAADADTLAPVDSTRGYLERIATDRAAQGFATTDDLLRRAASAATVLAADDVQQWRTWAENVIELSNRAVRNDVAWRDESAPPLGVSAPLVAAVTGAP